MKAHYAIEVYEDGVWRRVLLEMCREGRWCRVCRKDEGHRDICDHKYTTTEDEEFAKEHMEGLLKDYDRVRLLEGVAADEDT